MKVFLIFLFLIYSGNAFAQAKECHCEEDPVMDLAFDECRTISLANGANLYWQINCSKYWLTLDNNGEKIILDEGTNSDFPISYRINYHFIKEYKETVLFRFGCAATGPCSYVLIDKYSGTKVKEFNQLIQIDTDINSEDHHPYAFPFVVYFDPDSNHLLVYFVDKKTTLKIPFNEKTVASIPENQFTAMTFKKEILSLYFEKTDLTTKIFTVETVSISK